MVLWTEKAWHRGKVLGWQAPLLQECCFAPRKSCSAAVAPFGRSLAARRCMEMMRRLVGRHCRQACSRE